MASKIQVRRDTSDNWSSVNPILAQGEYGLNLDSGKVKCGDGITAWNDLDYCSPSQAEFDEHKVDYEEGVFTPFITFGGATTGIVYNDQVGRYTKIGRLCFGSFFIRLTSKGSATGNVAVGGIPFNILDAVPRPHFTVGRTRFLVYPSGASNIAMEFIQGAKSIALYGCGSDMDSVRLTNEHFKNNTSIYGTFFYAVNS